MDEKTKQNKTTTTMAVTVTYANEFFVLIGFHVILTLPLAFHSFHLFFFSFPYIIADTKQSWAAKQEI